MWKGLCNHHHHLSENQEHTVDLKPVSKLEFVHFGLVEKTRGFYLSQFDEVQEQFFPNSKIENLENFLQFFLILKNMLAPPQHWGG